MVDDRGQLTDASWTVPPGLDEPQQRRAEGLQRSLSAVVPLPDEAVGAGATWTVVDQQASGGVDLAVVRTYQLVERSGNELVLTMAITLDAPPAKVGLPAFQGDVQELGITGDQRLGLDLTNALPTLVGGSTFHLAVKGKKGLIPVSMILDVDQELSVR